VSFGGVVLDHFADQTLSLRNVGSVAFTFGQIEAPSSPFSIITDECSGSTLGPSGTCDVQIRFSPTDQGDHEGFFAVPLSGSSTNFAGVTLDGSGYGMNVTINQVSTENCPDATRLIVSVTDESDDFISGLVGGDFTLVEEGTVVTPGTVAPDTSNLSVVLALDGSSSVSNVLEEIKDAAQAFINDLEDGDEAAVFRFADNTEQVIGFTTISDTGKIEVNDAIEDIPVASGSTALYSVISEVCEYYNTAPAMNDRRAIVIITDGQDTASDIELEDAIDAAQVSGIPLFTIGLGTEVAEVLQALAGNTGGQYYDVLSEDVLETVYPQIAELLTNQYKIEYESNLSSGAFATVNLTVEYNGLTGEDSVEFEGCP
jgi:VWFA-related protein